MFSMFISVIYAIAYTLVVSFSYYILKCPNGNLNDFLFFTLVYESHLKFLADHQPVDHKTLFSLSLHL